MVLRSRILGFVCGIGMIVAITAAAQVTTIDRDFITARDVLVYIVGPGSILLFSILGWFVRGAYSRIMERLDRIEERINTLPSK